MDESKIENVMSELLGEGYRIVRYNGELSPMIEWVDWAGDPDDEDDEERVEVNFSDGTMETYPMGVELRQTCLLPKLRVPAIIILTVQPATLLE